MRYMDRMSTKTKSKASKQKRYSDETKTTAVRMMLTREPNETVEAIARKFGTTPTTLHSWSKQGWGETEADQVLSSFIETGDAEAIADAAVRATRTEPVQGFDTAPATHGSGSNGHSHAARADNAAITFVDQYAESVAQLRAENAELRQTNAELRSLLKKVL